jgi:hypothetical protein
MWPARVEPGLPWDSQCLTGDGALNPLCAGCVRGNTRHGFATMPARTPKSAKKTKAVAAKSKTTTPKNKNGGVTAKGTPGEIGRTATGTRINAFVSSRARRTQAKRDAR